MTSGKSLLQEVFTCFNTDRIDDARQVLAPGIRLSDSAGHSATGPDAVVRWLQGWKRSFPDGQLSIVDAVEMDGRVACESNTRGTHSGPVHAGKGMVPATGRTVSLDRVDFLRVRDGKVIEWKATFDPAELVRQLGVEPSGGAEARGVLQAAYDAFNAGRLDQIAAYLHPDVRLRDAGDVNLTGPMAVMAYFQSWKTAFPDARVAVFRAVEAGDTAVCEVRAEGTHTGTLSGPQGEIPPTYKHVSVPTVDLVRVRDGRILEWTSYYNQTEMMNQLGLGNAAGVEQRNVQSVRQAYDAFVRGDVPAILGLLAADVDWSVEAGPGSKVPWHMSVKRRDDVPRFFKAMAENLEVQRFTPLEIVAMGNTVAARVSFTSIVRKNGQKVEGEACQWFTFDADGLCRRWHSYENTAADVEAWSKQPPAGYQEHAPH